jgi:hypothetical protein
MPNVLQKIEHVFSRSDSLIGQVHSPRPRGECLPLEALSLGWVPVRSPALIGLNLPLIAIVGITGRGKKFTSTDDRYKVKLERLRSVMRFGTMGTTPTRLKEKE